MVGGLDGTNIDQNTLEVCVKIMSEPLHHESRSRDGLTCKSSALAAKAVQSDDLLFDIPISIDKYGRCVFLWIPFDAHVRSHLTEFDFAKLTCHLTPQLGQQSRFYVRPQ